MPHTPVSDPHRDRARMLRRLMTRAETLLWRYIKAHRIDGMGFRRQVPMGPYIVDFACHRARLIVELDGGSHDFEARQKQDALRDGELRKMGYRILRFTNQEVMSSLEGVVQIIRDTAQSTPPSLTLPHMGGGNRAAVGANDCESI